MANEIHHELSLLNFWFLNEGDKRAFLFGDLSLNDGDNGGMSFLLLLSFLRVMLIFGNKKTNIF